jgi:hypothetical protein
MIFALLYGVNRQNYQYAHLLIAINRQSNVFGRFTSQLAITGLALIEWLGDFAAVETAD